MNFRTKIRISEYFVTGGRTYPLRKYLFVFLIVAGVALFMYKDKPKSSTESTLGIGEILLLLSLTCDGLTGAVQERMKREHQTRPDTRHHNRVRLGKGSDAKLARYTT